ncbi:hypothetical protein MXD81_52240 [Microbacteriaceae bacterium K1510]|nr:hypothetical protein [Microbacteriaceae bacterium K1510]
MQAGDFKHPWKFFDRCAVLDVHTALQHLCARAAQFFASMPAFAASVVRYRRKTRERGLIKRHRDNASRRLFIDLACLKHPRRDEPSPLCA